MICNLDDNSQSLHLNVFSCKDKNVNVERQSSENQLNFSDWDHILFTRSMEMISSERSLRHLTNVLSYPYTIAGVLHENSPYNIKDRLTIEGLTSMAGKPARIQLT